MSCAAAKGAGLKTYWPLQACVRGHNSQWYTSTGGCVECAKLFAKQWRLKNRERSREVSRQAASTWRAKNPAQAASYRSAPYKIAANAARRRAGIKRRTPAWANRGFLVAIYAVADRVSSCTGIPWEVDHVIPLHGRNVSGLHVQGNLQLLPRKLNRAKSNIHSIAT
jgi:hypothetical protein